MLPWDVLVEKANHPTEQDLQTLQGLMALSRVTVFPAGEAGPVQISLSFECAWDPDHGMEVLTEKDAIKEIDSDGCLTACAWYALL